MSLVAQYQFNQPDLTVDSSGNGFTLTNSSVSSINDVTYGPVAYFNNVTGTGFTLPSPPDAVNNSSPRTISFWYNQDAGSLFFTSGTGNDVLTIFTFSGRIRIGRVSSFYDVGVNRGVINTWIHLAVTFTGSSVIVYLDGVQTFSRTNTLSTVEEPFYIGRDSTGASRFGGKMSDFRIYDDALSSSQISDMYTNGPHYQPPIIISPRVSSIISSIAPVDGAIAYRLTSQKTGTTVENIENDNFVDLQKTTKRLSPATEYTIRLYSTEDGVFYSLVEQTIITTLANLGINYEKNDYLDTNGRFNISDLEDEEKSLLIEVINDVFDTGDVLDINVSGKTKVTKFVKRGELVNVSDTSGVLAPFSPISGSGQQISMTLSDLTTVNVLYDDTTEFVTIGSTSYNEGDSFVLDGKKVTVFDI